VLADAVVVLPLRFVAFAVRRRPAGLRWRGVALLHLPALGWAPSSKFSGRTLPAHAAGKRLARGQRRGGLRRRLR
jgi:hypothetical protein